MRLFTAIDLPDEVRGSIEDLLARLRPTAPLTWSHPANLHITTKFIGECLDQKALEAKLAQVRVPPFRIEIRGLGWFPNPHHPHSFFAGVAAPEELPDLHRLTDDACAGLRIPRETKRFTPHLTLARIRTPEPLIELRKAIAELPGVEFGVFQATSFWLYSSVLRTGGSLYTKLKEFPLG